MVFKNKPKIAPNGRSYNYLDRKCKECSKEYKPMTNVQKYCSLTCQNRARRERHKEEIREYNKMYARKYPERKKKWNKVYSDKPEIRLKKNKWAKEYAKRDYVKQRINAYHRKQRKENPSERIENNIRARIYKKMKTYKKYGRNFPAKSERGIQINIIVKNLMINLPQDYNEKEYHIDHINPICSFNLANPEELNNAFAPENHRWLLAEDNLKKGKFDKLKSIKYGASNE